MEDNKDLKNIIKLHGIKNIKSSESSEEEIINDISKNQVEIVVILEKHKRKIERLEEAMGELQDMMENLSNTMIDLEERLPEVVYNRKYR